VSRGSERLSLQPCCLRRAALSMSPLDQKDYSYRTGPWLGGLLQASSSLPIGPHIRAAPAASLAGKPWLQIRQPYVIRPSIAVDRSPMRAVIIAAIDQETAHAGGARLG
jgi:hypothetical protein